MNKQDDPLVTETMMMALSNAERQRRYIARLKAAKTTVSNGKRPVASLPHEMALGPISVHPSSSGT